MEREAGRGKFANVPYAPSRYSSCARGDEKSGCKLYVLDRRGAPFWLKASWKNSGIVIGVVTFICIVFILSNMIWRIEVTGANPEVEHTVRQQLKK